jgi:type VI secretion system protein ImpB
MPESQQDKLKRVRPPRVKISYNVETGDARLVKELPFVVGVMGDFSGDGITEVEPMDERKFIQIDRDNFSDVMKRMKPSLNLRVDNKLQDDGSELGVQLKFESLDDFSPANVANNVEPLKKLLELRNNLRDYAAKVDRSPKLEKLLEKVLTSTGDMGALAAELGIGASGADTGASSGASDDSADAPSGGDAEDGGDDSTEPGDGGE